MNEIATGMILVGLVGLALSAAIRAAGPGRPLFGSPSSPIEPYTAMGELMDSIARSPARSRGWADAGGVMVSAWWVTDVVVDHQARWTSGYWILRVGEHQGPCTDLDGVYQLGLARLEAIAAERRAVLGAA